jgi:hypothetical protein
VNTQDNSPEFQSAVAAHRAALKKYVPIRDSYQHQELLNNKPVTDEEYITARAEFVAAQSAYDNAVATESERVMNDRVDGA